MHEIHLEDGDALDRIGGQQVDPDDGGARRDLADDLGPSTGCYAEIDDPRRPLEQTETLVEFDQLIGRARSIAFRLGAPDIGVVELAFEPAG